MSHPLICLLWCRLHLLILSLAASLGALSLTLALSARVAITLLQLLRRVITFACTIVRPLLLLRRGGHLTLAGVALLSALIALMFAQPPALRPIVPHARDAGLASGLLLLLASLLLLLILAR